MRTPSLTPDEVAESIGDPTSIHLLSEAECRMVLDMLSGSAERQTSDAVAHVLAGRTRTAVTS